MTDPSRLRSWFRLIAFAEAGSWLGLLIGMYLKYVPETTAVGVHVFGPIHGTIFLSYLALSLTARNTFGWSPRTFLLALAAAVPPFASVAFELYAERNGLLETAAEA